MNLHSRSNGSTSVKPCSTMEQLLPGSWANTRHASSEVEFLSATEAKIACEKGVAPPAEERSVDHSANRGCASMPGCKTNTPECRKLLALRVTTHRSWGQRRRSGFGSCAKAL